MKTIKVEMDFNKFRTAVAHRFLIMNKKGFLLYRTKVEKDLLWDTYLSSFPPGSDPIYKKRTEHNCSACRQFIRAVGNVVTIIQNKLVSIWDIQLDDPNYQAVADKLSALVRSRPISGPFFHYEKKVGVEKSFQDTVDRVKTFDHFFFNIPNECVRTKASIPTKLSGYTADHDVLLRSLTEITMDALDTVLDLIKQNSLYRGEENKYAVEEFRETKRDFDKTDEAKRDNFVWEHINTQSASVTRIRNTVIGTLLVDLSEGKDLTEAVNSFEAKVAPTNYKRPTALATKAMIQKARNTIESLGLISALERRYATLADITVNNILFANRDACRGMTANVFDDLSAEVTEKPGKLDKVEEVPVEKFLSDILPRATSVEVLVENKHFANLVSLIAPVDPTAGSLFKWDNNFSWAYKDELADSDIRRAVSEQGGRVDGAFRFSHSWNHPGARNASLMDLHVFMPGSNIKNGNGSNDRYGNRERVGWNNRNHSTSGGIQDVDYTSPALASYIPVENITFPTLSRMPQGTYICKIHNWQMRIPTRGGFHAEIEFGGNLYQYEYPARVEHKEWVTVAEVTLKGGEFSIKHRLKETHSAKEMWGIKTQTFRKVNVIMYSPNYWDEQTGLGNKHYFFMLDGCKNKGQARGFFNEFLKSELDPHRKVIEMVGAKMRTSESDNQLSGLGFSSTKRNTLLCRVKGSFTRTVKLVF